MKLVVFWILAIMLLYGCSNEPIQNNASHNEVVQTQVNVVPDNTNDELFNDSMDDSYKELDEAYQ